MDWETTQHKVKKMVFLLCGGAVITVTVHSIEHLFFGIMGERLILRVREKMFTGNFNELVNTFL
jgi:ATP-binding cassette subfamily B (MDR/TAP) protein 1